MKDIVRLTLAVFVLALVTPMASAQKGDTALLRACMTEGGNAVTCLGLISGPCIDNPDNFDTLAMAECFRREAAAWDQILNEDYQALIALLDAEQTEAIRDVQRAWIAFRDADCAFHHILIRGTMAVFTEAACLAAHTADRVFSVHAYLADAGGG